jgi:CRISPR-associated protein Csd1
MTILQSLDRYYDRMAARGEAEAPGYSREKIRFAIVLAPDGAVVEVMDRRVMRGKKLVPRLEEVPAAAKRTSGIAPNLLWEKTAYVLGRTAGEGKRTAAEHAAFKSLHLALLAETRDVGLLALRRFLEAWAPTRFDAAPFTAEMLDANIIFRLDGDMGFLHQRPAARALVSDQASGNVARAMCLISGIEAPIERLHPAIKGVESKNPPAGGYRLVSFNRDAFASYGKAQGDNAPTSETAAFRYGAALNRMLDRGSPNRLLRPVGDATVLFWADAREEDAKACEDVFAECMGENGPEADAENLAGDAEQTARLRERLLTFAEGRPDQGLDPGLDRGVRFHVLGLAPNTARLSVRFWVSDRFEAFAERLARHFELLEIEPRPWRAKPPSVPWLLMQATARQSKSMTLQQKFESVPTLLAGEVTRAILTGTPYPRSLLAAALIRLRAGDDPSTGWHACAIRAVLASHNPKEMPPVSLDREETNPAYQLGRMFAMVEIAQRMALGKVNAGVRDRYFGAATATPGSIFPLLLRGMQNHLGKLRKGGKGGFIEEEMNQIMEKLGSSMPRSLRLEEQGRFVIGYYHQRRARVAGKPVDEIADAETAGEGDNDE